MSNKQLRPAAGQSGTGLGILPCVAAGQPEHNPTVIVIQRLRRRFGLSEPHAGTIAHLAALGGKDGRS